MWHPLFTDTGGQGTRFYFQRGMVSVFLGCLCKMVSSVQQLSGLAQKMMLWVPRFPAVLESRVSLNHQTHS